MIFILSHKFAHRLLHGGRMESAPVTTTSLGKDKVYSFVEGEFQDRTAASMNLTGGDFEDIRNKLGWYNHILREDYVLPSSEPVQQTQSVASDPV